MGREARDEETDQAQVLADDRERSIVSLHRELYRPIASLAGLLLGDYHAGEEVAQEAFARLWLSWPALRDPDRAPAWLRSAAMNLSRSRLRRLAVARRHRAERGRRAAPGRDTAGEVTERLWLRARLARLPTRQREAVVLRYFADLSEADTAAAMGISPGAVKSHLHRALAALGADGEERE